jgi:hypothetical protein
VASASGAVGWLRKRINRLMFCAAAARKNCSPTNFMRPKRKRRSDLIFQFRKQSLDFLALRWALENSGVVDPVIQTFGIFRVGGPIPATVNQEKD